MYALFDREAETKVYRYIWKSWKRFHGRFDLKSRESKKSVLKKDKKNLVSMGLLCTYRFTRTWVT